MDSWPPEDTWYGVILWVLRVLSQSLNQSARIFFTRAFWLLRHTDEPQRGRNSCLWLQSRSVLSSFGVVLMSCRVNFHVVRSALQYSACRILCLLFIFADQVFIDPTFSGIFVCGPLQSLAVNVCTLWLINYDDVKKSEKHAWLTGRMSKIRARVITPACA